MPDDEAIEHELTDVLGDPSLVRATKSSLARLRDGVAGDDLAEMARDLLDGRISLRSVVRSGVYTESLLRASAGAAEWLDSMSPEEIERVADEARQTLALEHENDVAKEDDT